MFKDAFVYDISMIFLYEIVITLIKPSRSLYKGLSVLLYSYLCDKMSMFDIRIEVLPLCLPFLQQIQHHIDLFYF